LQATNSPLVTRQNRDRLVVPHVPHDDRAVDAAGHDRFAVGRKREAINVVRVAAERSHLFEEGRRRTFPRGRLLRRSAVAVAGRLGGARFCRGGRYRLDGRYGVFVQPATVLFSTNRDRRQQPRSAHLFNGTLLSATYDRDHLFPRLQIGCLRGDRDAVSNFDFRGD